MFYFNLFFYLFLVASSMADVRKEFGEFRLTHVDRIENAISIQRYYSSRSLFKGYFGPNWCSPLDYKLSFASNELVFFECEQGKYLTFKKSAADTYWNQDTQNTVTVTGPYFRYIDAHATYFFSMNGQLSYWVPNGKQPIYVLYKNNQITQLMLKTKAPFKVIISKDGLIEKIGTKTSFIYKQGLLNLAKQKNKIKWHYEYDEYLNMILWKGISEQEKMKYDNVWDRIVYLEDKNNCRFRFDYKIKNAKKFILESEKCLTTKATETLFEVVNPRLLVKSPTDTLGKEFRNRNAQLGETDAQTF